MSFDLTGRLALVTGSSRGLGWAFAQSLAQAGARVLLHGRDRTALAEKAAQLAQVGTPAAGTLAFDVTDGTAVREIFAGLESAHGPLEILLNNAGMTIRKPTLDVTDEDWQRVIDADLTSCFRMSREALRLMIPRGRGRIIMVSSIMGHQARPTIPAYVTAKTGLHGLVRALAVEFARTGVTVNAIAPGYFPTEANLVMRQDATLSAWVNDRIPMGRWGDPSAELGPAAVYLASDGAAYITGQVLTMDGGFTAAL